MVDKIWHPEVLKCKQNVPNLKPDISPFQAATDIQTLFKKICFVLFFNWVVLNIIKDKKNSLTATTYTMFLEQKSQHTERTPTSLLYLKYIQLSELFHITARKTSGNGHCLPVQGRSDIPVNR